ncbi:hypothetical protein HJC23_012445 [Cyclotella cryptica]|uniref:Uncharacterized protein n=1 Tax=Cyclotella cryptica TaxID=29204 RepID=A0ABD3NRW0_9STRA|eukprot:CCRYP_020064-RA/>CCRYP_020064-RA protein AED:0.04 eAED:0.04 QI:23/1/1/1/0/0/2/420/202
MTVLTVAKQNNGKATSQSFQVLTTTLECHPIPTNIVSLPVFNPDLPSSRETLTNHFLGLRTELSDAVIVACKALRTDDPGIFFMFSGDAEEIHAILGLPGSPVAPAVDAASSVLALRSWIVSLIPNPGAQLVEMPASSRTQGLSITNLSGQEFARVLFSLTALMPWGAEAMAAGRSAGSFHIIQGIGAGSCTITRGSIAAFV